MAVDPLIAKALTHLAVKVATDEETRKKMSMSQKKKVFTEEHKRNISKAKKRNNKDLQV